MRMIGASLLGLGLLLSGCVTEPSNTDLGLRVFAEVTPSTIRLRDTTTALRIRVLVSNPTDEPIIVPTGGPPYDLFGDPLTGTGRSFGYRIASATDPLNAGPSSDWWGSSVDTFPAHRTQYVETSFTLAQWRRSGSTVTPGEYRIRSFYNKHEGEAATLRVLP